ncbi:hypothetical protein HX882_06810 [Pseudomonas gingeri]|uniref:Uncharacterized protein n=1 Tax=Pseudomonas gingeri TaxID=117681 RepID=A0A7Y8C1U2_9PSED|nr:hypothetical protein [Pseudomonas gingeri]NWA24276.1 hypothetical protein [Pseudomonas gingeri]NWB95597.1 hypothetical protein [Pseudomonas gingeri]NWD73832.1 hypothetical protein [Pseudomonas gingeri]
MSVILRPAPMRFNRRYASLPFALDATKLFRDKTGSSTEAFQRPFHQTG